MPTQRGSTQAGGGFHLVTRLEGRSRKVSRDWMKGFTRQPPASAEGGFRPQLTMWLDISCSLLCAQPVVTTLTLCAPLCRRACPSR